ncbi:alpha/beta hydrolase fold protein [Pseudopedobacter saltans DSM 12145]|uniref:Alpha/beta hydrolase fold protein n=1 Tax=Pseudopedobacter saltans (strain ATCC 51119 / DSM 12145 / JCM 21818 / CCUG 39354 / LMG 10337 / NBRC 100064 / NCIMB 13643) TaxID=762903 RepID=F0SCD2_PSESL|nr:alpha/beta fold hydrolase [Pseudopedobacter saltans]ADY51729.1 alpha/beta hydrolase fold protein [Pseudopedobacter saltans DSM 12145]
MKKSNSCNLRIFLPLLFLLGFSSKLFAINPGRDYYLSPDSLGLQYQEVRLNTSDNLSLNCWDISTDSLKNKNTSIVIAYGDSGNMGSNLFLAKTLSNEGYKVILFDYRGFGKSDDFVIQKDMLYYNEFCEDLKTVLNYAKKRYPQHKTGIFGLSMGTAIAIQTVQKKEIDFLIGDGVIYDPTIIKNRLLSLFNKEVRLPGGAEKVKTLYSTNQTKILLFAGRQDIITNLADAEEILKLNSQITTLVTYVGNHLAAEDSLGTELFLEKIRQFLK